MSGAADHPTINQPDVFVSYASADRDCLLHAVEHGALHQGHIQITRQLMVDGVRSQ